MDRGIVKDNRDPAKRGRIKVQIPTRTGSASSDWIWPVVTGGYLVIPKPGDQVWIAYENEDPNFPIWVGSAGVSTSYKNRNGQALGDISLLLERVKDLETQLAEVEQRVQNLSNTKANIGHSH